ncbi:biotin-dependent carboxyltransferase family protein [Salinicoccus jeotgali]|uniref:Biotin-dependent carboxyltransferase family protein n=1 Tax=Salinicoccus jeotgali TaxID=381634 RepID=A0ABP7EKJ0_9STAP
MTGILKVLKPGVYTTVQDLGRYGHQSEGFSPAGAMDYRAFRLANQLLGNTETAAALEMTLQGGTFEVLSDTFIATAGAEMPIDIDGSSHPSGIAIPVLKGSIITIGAAASGARTYLAAAGGFKVNRVLGSASTHARSGIGGYSGRPLKASDRLAAYGGQVHKIAQQRVQIPAGDDVVHVVPGQQFERFDEAMQHTFFEGEYELTKDADRMGARLKGPELEATSHDVLSEPTQLGSIQVPKGGQPIVLLNDRQTAGGYAKIATVVRADIPKFVQKQPGETIRFKAVTVEEATDMYKAEMARIEDGAYMKTNDDFRAHIRPVSKKIEKLMGG